MTKSVLIILLFMILCSCVITKEQTPVTESPKAPVLEQPKAIPAPGPEKALDFTQRLELEKGHVYSAAVGDFNKDGFLDIVTGVYNGVSHVFLNNKDGTFTKSPLTDKVYNTQRVAVLDVNHDGNKDILLGNIHEISVLFKGNGDGTFTYYKEFDNSVVEDIAIADFNNDDYDDIAVASKFKDDVVYFNNQKGDFDKSVFSSHAPINLPATSIKAIDIDNDGYKDIVLGLDSEQSRIYLNEKNKTFVLSQELSGTPHTYSIATIDANRDGWTDIIQGNNKGSNILFTNKNGIFEASPMFGEENTYAVAAGDFDGDNVDEVVVGNYEIGVELYDNNGGDYTLKMILPTQYERDFVRNFAIGDFLNDGSMDLVVARDTQMSEVYLSR